LIQHFNRCKSLYDYIANFYDDVKYDIYNILYQVYFSLYYLGRNYTHYDLHSGNILLYKPFEDNTYITMRYHTTDPDEIYTFKTEFIAKIIDYGRNYFNNGETNTFKIMRDYICNKPECPIECGSEVGYDILRGEDIPGNFHWINPIKSNLSHDLRLAYEISNNIQLFPNGKIHYMSKYGTPELFSSVNDRVLNVPFMKLELEGIINKYNQAKSSKKYDSTWKEGLIMDIYEDGRDYELTYL
jgi:hypothetical protein